MKGVTTARNKFNSSKARFSKQNAKMLAHFRLAFNYNSHHIPLFSFTYSILPSSSSSVLFLPAPYLLRRWSQALS